MRNVYFNNQVRSEQNLFEDITIEALKIYGQDVYYIPRDIVSEDRIFGDDIPSRFNSSYRLEMYIENIEGFDGEGDLFTRFGVEIRDEATFIVARRRWTQTVKRYDNEISGDRPREGDLIYLPLSKSLFQIMHVEHEQPFYQLNNLPTYKMRCTLFEYNDEDLDTGIQDVDAIEIDNAYTYVIRLNETSNLIKIGDTATQTLSDGTILTAEVSKWSDSDQILNLVHLGASDGDFHTFVSTQNITINDSDFTVETILADDNKISQNEQNDDFSTFSDDFIDFSENNPFGDPENS
jgi:hypothetical protein